MSARPDGDSDGDTGGDTGGDSPGGSDGDLPGKPPREPDGSPGPVSASDGGDLLARAHALARAGDAAGAAALAAALPDSLAHTRHILAANAALRRGDHAGWLAAVNAYLARWQVAPVSLAPGAGSLLDRLRPASGGIPAGRRDGPLVSVILAAWQAAPTVAAAVRSILGQSWGALELIAVDDASTDATPAILHRLAAGDPRMQVVVNPVNVGPYVSRNIALLRARGDWITLQDADDWSHPQRLERHLRSVLRSRTPPPASSVGMLRMTPEGLFDQLRPVGGDSRDGALQHAPMSTLFAAGFLRDRLGSWDCARFGADSELMARAGCVMGGPPPRLLQFGLFALDHPGSLTANPVFGVHPRFGVAPARQAYRAAWRGWQRAALSPATAHLAFPPGPRRYPLPPEADVTAADLARVLAAAGIGG